MTETQVFRPSGLGMRFLPTPNTTDVHYHPTDRLTTLTPTQTCPTANVDATGDFILFWYFPPPTKGGAGWGRGARQQQQKSAAATAAAAARARENEINTARRKNRVRTCRLVGL